MATETLRLPSPLRLHLKTISAQGSAIILVGRDENNARYTVHVSNFRPYFYVPVDEERTLRKRGLEYVEGLPSIFGEPTFKVFVKTPTSISKSRKGFSRTYEADVPYTRRFLIDVGIHDGFEVHGDYKVLGSNILVDYRNLKPVSFRTKDRQLLYDIETNKPEGSKHYSPPTIASGAVTAFTFYDSFEEAVIQTHYWHPEHGVPGRPKVETRSQWSHAYQRHIQWIVHTHGTEVEMLTAILRHLKSTRPDVMEAWNGHHGMHRKNGTGFDVPYMINRLRNVGISPGELSPLGNAFAGRKAFGKDIATQTGTGKWVCNIDGIQLIDALTVYEIQEGGFTAQVPFRDLKRVTEKFTGKKLRKDPARDFNEWHLNGTDEFLSYSFDDVDALIALEKSEGYLDFARDMQQFVGAEDANKLFTPMSLINCMLLRLAREEGVCVPTSEGDDDSEYEAEGGFVLDPQFKGLQDYVGILDLTTMYVHIIISGNISPETHVPHPTEAQMEDLICLPSDMGPQFFLKPSAKEGMLPKLCKKFRALRKKYDDAIAVATSAEEVKKLKQARQPAKQLLLGVWGTSLSKFFCLHKPECGSCITGTGRHIHHEVREFVASRKGFVTYGDSVPGEEPVVVRDLNTGRIDVLAIQDLATRWEKVEVWSDLGFTRIKRFIRKPNRKAMYAVRTRSGVVHVTEDHSLLREDSVEVRPTDITPGTKLLHAPLPPITPYPTSYTAQQAWLLGAFVADGSCDYYTCPSGEKWSFAINKADVSHLAKCAVALEEGWHFKTKVDDVTASSGCRKLRGHGNDYGDIPVLVSEFRAICYTSDKLKRVPVAILNGPRVIREAFLDGYFAGDGDKSPRYRKRWHKFETNSRVLAQGIVLLLESVGSEATPDLRFNRRKDGRVQEYWSAFAVSQARRKDAVEITKLQQVRYDGPFVYDLETVNHHFSAGIGRLVVHNTDGFACRLPAENPVEYGEELCVAINQFFDQLAKMLGMDTHGFEIGLETVYHPFVQGDQKKQYAGLVCWSEGTWQDPLVFMQTGVSGMKSDAATVTRETCETVLKAILNKVPSLEVIEYVRSVHDAVLEGEIPLDHIIKAVGLNLDIDDMDPKVQSNYIVKAARHGRDMYDFEYPPGARVRVVALKGGNENWVAIPDGEELPDDVRLDLEKHAEASVLKPVQSILSWVGLEIHSVKYGTTTTMQRRL